MRVKLELQAEFIKDQEQQKNIDSLLSLFKNIEKFNITIMGEKI